MKTIDINNFRASAEAFLCASTPTYLYDNLKQLQEVEKLANELSTKDLYELCNQVLAKDKKSWDDELAFYIPLIALSFKTYSETHSYLLRLRETDKYKWTKHIISLIISDLKVITEYREETVKNIAKIILPEEFPGRGTTAVSEVRAKKEPQITLPEEDLGNPATSSNEINICNEDKKND